MNSRFQRNIFILLFTLVGLSCQPTHEEREELSQPNILFMIADDWSYPHAGIYGDPVVRTPTFDMLARQGALFTNAYCASPSCSPSRASILTGRYPHQLESAGNLWSIISSKYPNWVSLMEKHGYHTGMNQKGWGPGDFIRGGYSVNPAGQAYDSFQEFYANKQEGQSFSYWYGSTDPHRPYTINTGVTSGMNPEEIVLPEFLPGNDCVRNDIMDYYFEVERFDRECGQILKFLSEKGELDNTIIVMTSDNGMPFPRAKANLYDYGTRMPLAIFWKERIEPNQILDQFVNFIDFAPTILEATGIDKPDEFSGKSLLPLLLGNDYDHEYRSQVFLERERHANVRKGDLSYPMRALRNNQYLYIRNMIPGRWPAGDPETHQSVGQYGDVDNSITKFITLKMQGSAVDPDYFELSFGMRPEEELYDIQSDPYNITNLASEQEFQLVKNSLKTKLDQWMKETGDLRFEDPGSIFWDTVEYTPTYQRNDFNLEEEINDYKMKVSEGYGRFKEAGCLEE